MSENNNMDSFEEVSQAVENEVIGKKAKKQKAKKSVGQEILEWILTIVVAVVAALAIRTFIFEPVRVDGHSMDDTLADGEIMFVSKYDYGSAWLLNPIGNENSTREAAKTCKKWAIGGNPERFDVVICHYPNRGNTNFVKRVIGLPGETVTVRNGYVYIGDSEEPLEDTFINDEYRKGYGANCGPYQVGENEYFMMGDHRNDSNDSRSVGPLAREMIVGHVRQVLFPFNAWRPVE